MVASDADADPLSYAARDLPVGLVIAPATGLITGTPIIPGSYQVIASASDNDNKGPSTDVSFAWVVQTPALSDNTPKPVPGEVRFVRLEELTEVNSKPWGSIAELNLVDVNGANLPRTGWVASADTSDRLGNAIDGIAASLWHSQWGVVLHS